MVRKNLVVEDARILFRNFSGKEGKFNRAGDRNFCVLFDKETGEDLLEQGWNLRILPPREDGEDPSYVLQVTVSYNKMPPKVYMIKGRKKIELNEDTIRNLDTAEISSSDVIIRPYNWDVNGKTGVKAYLNTIYVELRGDVFASKYDYLMEPASDYDGDNMPF